MLSTFLQSNDTIQVSCRTTPPRKNHDFTVPPPCAPLRRSWASFAVELLCVRRIFGFVLLSEFSELECLVGKQSTAPPMIPMGWGLLDACRRAGCKTPS